jgi:hypothetical protein
VGHVHAQLDRLGFDGSTKVQMSLATDPNTSIRFGDDSRCATSSTWYVRIKFGIESFAFRPRNVSRQTDATPLGWEAPREHGRLA